jgi:glucuronate isomerase
MVRPKVFLPDDRYFDPNPRHKEIAQRLYASVADLPLVCPHGHVDVRMFADEDYSFGTPVDLLIIPDHYVFRMLYSHGIPLEKLGVPRLDGGQVEGDHRAIWQLFADNFYLFRGTPTGVWFTDELYSVFGVEDKLTGESAQDIYDQIAACLESPDFRPRKLFERFNIEVLCTTDVATDRLDQHCAIRESGWSGRVVPTFRPDAVVNIDTPGWRQHVQALTGSRSTAIRRWSARWKTGAPISRRWGPGPRTTLLSPLTQRSFRIGKRRPSSNVPSRVRPAARTRLASPATC